MKYLLKIIKYEDLMNKTYVVFTEIIKFINKITKIEKKLINQN